MKHYRHFLLINFLVVLLYWGVSHLNWLLFHHVGILPMPIWPAAAVALIVGLCWGWKIAPALAVGTILANHYSLGATWGYAACVAVMNTAGPLMAVWLVNRKSAVITPLSFPVRLLGLMAAGLLLAPALTASGGIGSQWLLGMIRWETVADKWLRWFMAHSLGALLFVAPVLVFSPSLWQQPSDKRGTDWLKHASKTALGVTIGLALLLWFGDTLLKLLWFRKEMVSVAESLLPIHSPQELFSRLFVSVTVLFAGGAVSQLLKSLANSHRNLEQSNRALTESETLQRTLLANLPAGVVVIDPVTRMIESVNTAAAVMFGDPAESIIGHRCHDFLCPACEDACPVMDLGNKVDNAEREMVCADGSRRSILKSVQRIRIGGREKLLECFLDITERKLAEEALLLKDRALASSVNAVIINDITGRTLYTNDSFLGMFGYTKEEAGQLSPRQIAPSEEDYQRVFSTLQTEGVYVGEGPARRKDGSFFDAIISATVIAGPDGRPIATMGSFVDISERKQAEEALRESEETARALLNATSDAAFLTDTHGILLILNTHMAQRFGCTVQEMTGTNVYDFIPEDINKRRLEHIAGVVETAHAIRFEDQRAGMWLENRIYPIFDAKGKVVKLAVFSRDITERKLAEEALRKYEHIVSASQDVMALISPDYVHEAVNDSFLSAFQKSREEVVGRTVAETIGKRLFNERIRARIDTALSGQTVRCQESFHLADGSSRLMDITYFPFFDEGGKVVNIVFNARDITEKRNLEKQLMQSQKIESIGTLAGGVAHEINNPINGIMNYAQLILDRMQDADAPEREYAREILHETGRIAGIVRNLLTFARNEKQSHSPALVSDIISSVLSLIQTVMRHDQITLELSIPEDLPKIKCRSQQIQQVLMNLMTNARDALNERYPGYSPEKRLRVVAAVFWKQDRKYIRTTVEDSGTGIPLEIRDRIFDPFFTTKPKETGTGLGLSISYGIVRDHSGELSVESEPGRYTRFHVDLPVNNGWSLPEK